jgi:alkylation response protein AidB-like acyl-CoA dehydrogenase
MAKLYDRRDVDFLLYEVLKVTDLLKYPRYKEQSEDVYKMVMDAAEKISHEVILPTNIDGDRIPLKFENGNVTVPPSFGKALKEYRDGGWLTLMDDEEVGGQAIPASVGIHSTSLFGGANFAFTMCPGMMHGAAKMIEDHGTERQKKIYMEKMYAGYWGGSMCLTEAQAGSDVGNIATVAKRMPDGTYRLKGQKIFITWGDHNLSENIVHPVLARIEGDPAGTKGISIFLVPKFLVNEDGSLGKRNDVVCAGIEHKMGIHGSPTTTLVFGDNDDCYAELLGQERSGMKIMFGMMNEARLGVGVQGLSMSEPAYLYALEYAADRRQGSSVKDFKNPEAPRISILHHPDVRRMIIDMKAKVEAMRALIGITALNLDLVMAADGADKETASAIVELLTPIAKSWCTDTGFDVIENAIQVMGGHGYLRDHPLEQYMRDLKIASLYEGTNGIQAMDLLGRKLGMKGGMVLMSFLGNIDRVTSRVLEAKGALAQEANIVAESRNALAETAMALGMTFAGGDLDLPLLNAKPFLDAMGEVVAGWLLLWEAEVAAEKLAALAKSKGVAAEVLAKTDADAAFYDGKVKTAKYYIARYLPVAKAKFDVIRGSDRSAIDAVFGAYELQAAQ